VNAPALLRNIRDCFAQWGCELFRARQVRVVRWGVSAYIATLLTLIAVVALMFLLDAAASGWARHLPLWFVALFERITDFGLSGWFLFPFGFVLLCLAAVTSPVWSSRTQAVLAALTVRFGYLFLAIGVPGLFAAIVKRMIGRARPYVGPHDDPFAYIPFIWKPEFASMPSGHSTTAAAAAVAIGAVCPSARGVMWLYALLIMFSRVVVLEHHPSDVLAGALVGAVGADIVRRWFAARRLLFSASNLKASPGPSFSQIWLAIAEIVRGKSGQKA
jgi:membrane-associated phospholipid phosphatase